MKKHRKLFQTNSTDCSYYSCNDPFSDYYFFPSPPPPPEYSSRGERNDGVTPPIIVLFALLSLILLILLYYIVIAKSCLGLFRRNQTSDSVSGDGDGPPGTESDHPVWLIATAGLQQSVINSIAVAKYRRSEGLIDGTDCSVCLSEFREGETLRILPKCGHAFHVACIDTWLRSHTNCPLCRAGIVAPPRSDRSETAEIGASGGSGERLVVAESGNDVVRGLGLRRSVSMDHGEDGGQRREEKFSRVKKRSLSCGSGMRFLSSR